MKDKKFRLSELICSLHVKTKEGFRKEYSLLAEKNERKMAFIKKIERDTRTFLRNHTPSQVKEITAKKPV